MKKLIIVIGVLMLLSGISVLESPSFSAAMLMIAGLLLPFFIFLGVVCKLPKKYGITIALLMSVLVILFFPLPMEFKWCSYTASDGSPSQYKLCHDDYGYQPFWWNKQTVEKQYQSYKLNPYGRRHTFSGNWLFSEKITYTTPTIYQKPCLVCVEEKNVQQDNQMECEFTKQSYLLGFYFRDFKGPLHSHELQKNLYRCQKIPSKYQ